MGLSRKLPPAVIVILSIVLACSRLHLAEAARRPGSLKLDRLRAIQARQATATATATFSSASTSTSRTTPAPPPAPPARPGAKDCATHWMTQDLDHFSWHSHAPGGITTFKQRYLAYDAFWEPGGPIFFYTGNEAGVELYADSAGLMWEHAETFGALLIFAEHRYYGQSQPFVEGHEERAARVGRVEEGTTSAASRRKKGESHENDNITRARDPSALRFLTHEQALADYARLIYHLRGADFKRGAGAASPVVAFGGSYGGMLAAWMRIKYPGSVVGAVAASAPVLAFPGMSPAFDDETYWGVVTRDAAAAVPGCDRLVRRAFAALFAPSSSVQLLTATFRLCAPPTDRLSARQRPRPEDLEAEVEAEAGAEAKAEEEDLVIRSRLAMFLAVAFDTMAMGSYPYPSNYMTGGAEAPKLPAWPMEAACRAMTAAVSESAEKPSKEKEEKKMKGEGEEADGDDSPPRLGPVLGLLEGLRDAAGVFNNASGSAGSCYDLPAADDEYDGIWDYQWCTELLPQETYFAMDGVRDMFWRRESNASWVADRCRRTFGQEGPRRKWIAATTGGGVTGLAQASNIVFSNGALDPWSSGGVMINLTSSVTAVVIAEGGHHTDLFFSHPADPPSVVAARRAEMELVKGWIGSWRLDQARLSSLASEKAMLP